MILDYSCSTDIGSDTLYQVNSFSHFSEGNYEGFYSYSDILEKGDFGIGTFDQLNGEMVLLDGEAYRIEANGDAIKVDDNETAPVATFCHFDDDLVFEIQNLDLDMLKAEIDSRLPNLNLFYAVKIEGEFFSLLTRSIYPQEEPYRKLEEVVKEEVRRESSNVRGTIVGFRAPAHIEQPLWKSYHMHFISGDYSFGGHVHNATVGKVTVTVDIISDLQLILNKG